MYRVMILTVAYKRIVARTTSSSITSKGFSEINTDIIKNMIPDNGR